MKSPIAYYLMLLYATVMLKPLLPLVADTFSHYFNEQYHQMVVHAQHGEHHLDTEIAESREDNNSNKSTTSEKAGNFIPVHFASETSTLPCLAGIGMDPYPPATLHDLSNIYLLTDLRPPDTA